MMMEGKKIIGEDIMALNRFAPDVKYMVIVDVLQYGNYMPGERVRRFFSQQGMEDCLRREKSGEISILEVHEVNHGDIYPGNIKDIVRG